MTAKLKLIIGAALAVVFIDLLVIGAKIFGENYDLAAEGAVGLVGFAVVGGCGAVRLYRELKKRHKKKGQL